MTDEKEISCLIERVRSAGALVFVTYDGDEHASDERGFIQTVKVFGLPGIGPAPMSPLYAAERMREVLVDQV
jgi:hypothetical protein